MGAAPTARHDPHAVPAAPPRPRPEDGGQWVVLFGRAALLIFCAVPALGFLLPRYTGRIVWTVVVAALPLFIILVGYHRWRRICPLAFFAQLPARWNLGGTRRAGPWLEANYPLVVFSVFFVSLWLRLVATNGDGPAIAVFFLLLSAAAFLFGVLYTGKSWCNFICPVSFVEKIYTEPSGLRDTSNSQCARCTACKKSCPDINEESGYWKEIASHPRRFVMLAFPGLVFGFYFYYFLQSGTWDYYFGGSWTRQPGLYRVAFLSGHDAATAGFFFYPRIPRAAAAFLTLAVCAGAGFLLFSLAERLLARRSEPRDAEVNTVRARHITLSVAAFAALVTFYTFAGAPTLRLVPWLPHFFIVAVVLVATLSLVRRLPRSRQTFAEETLARNFLKRWEWPDVAPPRDLREAFLLHTIRLRETSEGYARLLAAYKEAVREALADGFVTPDAVNLLDGLRNQLQIKLPDHEKIMAALAAEEASRLRESVTALSAEKRLQLTTYKQALGDYFVTVLGGEKQLDEGFVRRLQREFQVTETEHNATLVELLGGVSDGYSSTMALGFLQSWRAGQAASAAKRPAK